MKFGQTIKYSLRNIFVQNYLENELGRKVPDLFLFFEKTIYKVKVSGQHLSFNTF